MKGCIEIIDILNISQKTLNTYGRSKSHLLVYIPLLIKTLIITYF